MDFPTYALDILSKSKCNIKLVSDGGFGKTTAFLEIYRRALATPVYSEGKRLIPIYVPLSLCDTNTKNSILRYTVYNYTPFDTSDTTDTDAYIANLVSTLLNCDNSDSIYLFLLDAINENHFGQVLIGEMNQLGGYKNAAVITSGRYDEHGLDGFKTVLLKPIDEKIIKSIAPDADESMSKLLSNPFYLSRYKELTDGGRNIDTQNCGVFDFLREYVEWTREKYVRANATQTLGDLYSFKETVAIVLDELLPSICFEMCREHTLSVGQADKKIKNNVLLSFLNKAHGGAKIRFVEDIYDSVFEKFYVPLGFFAKADGGYRITHEIYRDYFAASHIYCSVKEETAVSSRYFRCSRGVMDMLAGALLQKPCFVDETGELTASDAELLAALPDGAEGLSTFANRCFVFYNLVESLPNGSARKNLFCKRFETTCSLVFRRLKARLAICSEKPDVNIFELIRIYAEVLRRNKKYRESSEVCEYLKEICSVSDNPHAERYIYKARHNVAKCNLYRAFDLASAENGEIVPETLEIYREAADELCKLCELGYAESRSQYAMLISYPDAVSARYIDACFDGVSVQKRREQAFFINIETVRREYKKDFDNTSFYYPLEQCASALLHNEISCLAEPAELEFFTFEELIYGSDIKFGEYSADFEKSSYAAAKIMLDKLRQKKSSRILDCLYAKLMLLDGSDERGFINSLLLSSDTQPLSLFMHSVYNNAAPAELDAVECALVKKAGLRAMDAFDAVYIKQDIELVWKALKNRREYSDEYIKAVNKMLKIKL